MRGAIEMRKNKLLVIVMLCFLLISNVSFGFYNLKKSGNEVIFQGKKYSYVTFEIGMGRGGLVIKDDVKDFKLIKTANMLVMVHYGNDKYTFPANRILYVKTTGRKLYILFN